MRLLWLNTMNAQPHNISAMAVIISFMDIYLFMIEMQLSVGAMCLSQQQHHETAKGNG